MAVVATQGQDDLLTADETARLLKVTRRTLSRWTLERGLPVVRLSQNCKRYRRAQVLVWVDAVNRQEGARLVEARPVPAAHRGRPRRAAG